MLYWLCLISKDLIFSHLQQTLIFSPCFFIFHLHHVPYIFGHWKISYIFESLLYGKHHQFPLTCRSVGNECKILMVEFFFNSLEMRMQRVRSSKVKKKLSSQLKTDRSTRQSIGHTQNVSKELRSTA